MSGDKRDLTRIEDLSEYLHEDDAEVDRQLQGDLPPTPVADLDLLPDEEESDALPPTPFVDSEDGSEDGNHDESSEANLESSLSFEDSNTDEALDFSDDGESEAFSFDADASAEETDFPTEFDFSDESTSENEKTAQNNDSYDFADHTDAGLSDDDLKTTSLIGGKTSTQEVVEKTSSFVESSFQHAKPSPDFKTENFNEVQQYARSLTYGAMTQGGNPPFSIVLRHIKYQEDCEDILIIMRDHGLVNDDSEKEMKRALESGSLLVSQLSEYSAIYLAHRLRRFDLELQLGLSDELHPSKSYGREQERLINRTSLKQNHHESFQASTHSIDLNSIIITTSATLPGQQVLRYLGVITEHALVDEAQLQKLSIDNNSDETSEIYDLLAQRLKGKVLRKGGNALLGLNYQLTPMANSMGDHKIAYKVTCSGTAVFLSDMGV